MKQKKSLPFRPTKNYSTASLKTNCKPKNGAPEPIKKNSDQFGNKLLFINQKGFTLLEIMIVMTILATITVVSSKSMQEAIKNKIKLQNNIDDMSAVRDSLKLMERDLNLAFHYTDLEIELKDAIKKRRSNNKTTQQPGGPPPAQGQASVQTAVYNPNDPNDPLNKKAQDRIDPTTQFDGKEDKLFFPTLNTSRMREDIRQANFIKVGYALQSCKKPDGSDSSSCLVRKTNSIVDGDNTKVENGEVILPDVTEFKLRYIGKGMQEWVSEWSSEKGDGIRKGRFPDAVEISLKVERGPKDKKKKISMQIVAAIRFPNNTLSESKANGSSNTPSSQGLGPNNLTNPTLPDGSQSHNF